MATFLSLPTELILHVIAHLPTNDLTSLLQINQKFYSLTLPTFISRLHLRTLTLIRCPFTQPSQVTAPTTDHVLHTAHLQNLKNLSFTLTTPLKIYKSLSGFPFICTHGKEHSYLTFEYLNKALHTSLCGLAQTITHHSTLLSNLKHVSVSAPEPDPQDLFPTNHVTRTHTPRIHQYALISLLHALGHCKNIETLEVDTNTSEETSWTPSCGVGHSCANHVCAVFAETARKWRKLRMLRWRRREVCARIFDAFVDAKGNEEGEKRGPMLEKIVVDLRLPETQLALAGAYEAMSRECRCQCWCASCLKRHESSEVDEDGEQHQICNEGVDGDSLLEKLAMAGKRAAETTQAKGVLVAEYEHPDKDLENDARKAVVLNCGTGEMRQLKPGENV